MLFSSFTVPHLAYLAAEIVIGTALALHFARWRRVSPERAGRALDIMAGATMAAYVVPVILICATDAESLWRDNLPLHLCSAAGIAVPVAVWTRNATLLNVAWALALPGAVAALLTPSQLYHAFAWFSVHYFFFNLSHWLIVMTAIGAVAAGLFRPEIRYYWRVLGLGAAFMAVVYPVNKALGTNFMFVNWPEPGTPLESLGNLFGNPGYIGGLVALAAAVIAAMYGVFAGGRRLRGAFRSRSLRKEFTKDAELLAPAHAS
jgi:hypothetical integral membrane protein (TIGR02206 family)